MPNPLPGPSSCSAQRPATDIELPSATGKGVLSETVHRTTMLARATITDTFSDLDEFTTVAGEPVALFGRLAGEGVVRHNMELLTDSCKVTATVGVVNIGSARLAVCGDKNLAHFYAIEAEQIAGPVYKLHLIKGSTATGVLSGILGWVLDQVNAVLSLFNPDAAKAQTHVLSVLTAGDTVGVWYDQPNSVVRGYINDVERLSLPVPRSEIPHGPGYRYHGAAAGITSAGALFTDYQAEDVAPVSSAPLNLSVELTSDVQWAAHASVTRTVTAGLTAQVARGPVAGASQTVTAALTASATVS